MYTKEQKLRVYQSERGLAVVKLNGVQQLTNTVIKYDKGCFPSLMEVEEFFRKNYQGTQAPIQTNLSQREQEVLEKIVNTI